MLLEEAKHEAVSEEVLGAVRRERERQRQRKEMALKRQ
jgi:hypothetical protein